MNIKSRKMPEYVIYIFLWLLFLIIPIITNNYNSKADFLKICFDWLRMLPFVLIFIINSIWLLPLLLFKGHTNLYVIILVMAAIVISTTFQVLNPVLYKNDPKLLEQRILQDPQWGREEMRPGATPSLPGNAPSSPELFKSGSERGLSENRRIPRPGQPLFQFINTLFISLLIAGFNTAIAVTNRWFTEEQARKEIEKEHMLSDLAFLQNQVSPHFFMNTLNNIHSLIEADQKLAQNAVLKLSEMMRYLLYESGRGTTSLSKEIEFLKSYVKLMQLRVDDSVKVSFDLPENFVNVSLPPLLFISFIENAFKHGVSYREPSFLSFRITQKTGSLEFMAVNTVSSYRNADPMVHHVGIGLENIKKRLDLLYGNKYKLNIDSSDNEFKVMLIIPT
jgi:CRISPR/Cas system CSM-associated protein Csm2 small subunit